MMKLYQFAFLLCLLPFLHGCVSYSGENSQTESYSVKPIPPGATVAVIDITDETLIKSLSVEDVTDEEDLNKQFMFGMLGGAYGGADQESKTMLFNILSSSLGETFKNVLEREKIIKLITEQKLSTNDFTNLTDKEKSLRLAKLLGVDFLIDGEIITNNVNYKYRYKDLDQFLMILPYIGPIFMAINFAMGKTPQAIEEYDKVANATGMPVKTSKFELDASSFSGITMRIIEVSTGKIVFVGAAVRAECNMKLLRTTDIEQINKYDCMKVLCKTLLERAQSGE